MVTPKMMPDSMKMPRKRKEGKFNNWPYADLMLSRFFSKLFNKQGMGDRAYAKWSINNNGNKKICAFSEDEKQLLVVT